MNWRPPLQFKIATEDWEFDLIHRLNYKTFVDEIPQHEPSADQRLVDKFHAENTYVICLCGRELAGMLALRGQRPFSLDHKLPDLDSYLPPGRSVCEIRLLAVEKTYRRGQVFQGLLATVWKYAIKQGYDSAIISGTTRQQKLYAHVGFVPFGPLVGGGDALFQPMFLSQEAFEGRVNDFLRDEQTRMLPADVVNFLPGPVAIHDEVRNAFEQAPESHRSEEFVAGFQGTKQLLCELTNARQAEVLLGSGTLANDAVAGQLALLDQPGLVLINGEFGERLLDQARRFGLAVEALAFPWGEALDFEAIEARLDRTPAGWLWCAHCETSTGVLNDINRLKALCAKRRMKLCLDCISSIGTLPVDLRGVYLATCASGKGLGSYPGLAMVFYHHDLAPAKHRLPRYLDLEFYARNQGIPFTHSSNLLHALQTAIQRVDWPQRFQQLEENSAWLRARLAGLRFSLIGEEAEPAPAVVTIEVPAGFDSASIGRQLREAGYLLSYNSEYLRRRNWIQICLMGECSREKLVPVISWLHRLCFPQPKTVLQPAPAEAQPAAA